MTSKYNATVVGKLMVTPDIMILRVNTDAPRDSFESGQYTVLGLYGKEARSLNSEEEFKPSDPEKLIQRAYSIASHRAGGNEIEFYISQVKTGQLTPRLFNLNVGDRMYISERIVGMFKLSETPANTNIAMIATGTGVAPYMSFLRSHIAERTQDKMAIIHGATHQWDLGYYSELSFLASTFPNLHYLPTVTEPDETWHGHSLWIEEMLEQKVLSEKAGIDFDPEKTHVFLCGNPNMIKSVSSWLEENYGYVKHTKRTPGSLHVEEF